MSDQVGAVNLGVIAPTGLFPGPIATLCSISIWQSVLMCGRYATTQTPASLRAEFEVGLANSFADVVPNYNVAPTNEMPIIVQRSATDGGSGPRELRSARWGLIPSWAKDRSIGNRMINARSETVAEKPSFRKAFAARRAVVPADGYYEWYVGADKKKQPFFITPKDRSVLSMAGLYELWKDPETTEWTTSFTIITTSAEDDLGRLHDRMPLIVGADSYADWLDPSPHDAAELLGLLVPAAPGRLDAFPVSATVGNVRNNTPDLMEPVPTD